MRSQFAFKNFIKNAFACSPFLYRSISICPFWGYKRQAPAFDKYVHGGKAIIISHLPQILCSTPSIVKNLQFPLSNGITSCCICHSGCPPEHSIISQEYASCPSLHSSMVTAWDSSQATSIFIFTLPMPRRRRTPLRTGCFRYSGRLAE